MHNDLIAYILVYIDLIRVLVMVSFALVEVDIAFSEDRMGRCGDFIIVEQHPPLFSLHVDHIMSTMN